MGPVNWYFICFHSELKLPIAYEDQIFHMLEYRREELSLITRVAIRDDGHQIRQLTKQAATASDLTTVLTRDMCKDSKFIKIITFLALLYAPASLAAVSWLSLDMFLSRH